MSRKTIAALVLLTIATVYGLIVYSWIMDGKILDYKEQLSIQQ